MHDWSVWSLSKTDLSVREHCCLQHRHQYWTDTRTHVTAKHIKKKVKKSQSRFQVKTFWCWRKNKHIWFPSESSSDWPGQRTCVYLCVCLCKCSITSSCHVIMKSWESWERLQLNYTSSQTQVKPSFNKSRTGKWTCHYPVNAVIIKVHHFFWPRLDNFNIIIIGLSNKFIFFIWLIGA